MTNSLPTGSLRKGAKEKYLVQKIPIIPRKLSVVRTKESGDFWSMLFYVPGARGNKQIALRTTDVEVAKDRALEQYYSLKARIDAGDTLSAMKARDLVDRYLEAEEKRVVEGGNKRGGIVPDRFKTIRSTLVGHFLPFVKPNTKIGKIPETKFLEYVDYRRSKQADAAPSTLSNEMSMIGKMIRFAVGKGLLRKDYEPQFPKLPTNTQPYAGGGTGRRDEFSFDEWMKLGEYIDGWHEKASDSEDLYARKVVRIFIYVACFSGLRPSEMRKLKWSMIEFPEAHPTKVKINVPPLSKTGARVVLPLEGTAALLKELRRLSKHTAPNDYVFADLRGGKFISTRRLYGLWDGAMSDLGFDQTGKKLEYYSLRHTYCTQQILTGIPIPVLSQNMGTSVHQIQKHYSHVRVEEAEEQLTRYSKLGIKRKRSPAENLLNFSLNSMRERALAIPGIKEFKMVKV